VGDRLYNSVAPRLRNDLPLSFREVSQTHDDAQPGTAFSALIRSYLKVAYYSGLSAAWSFLQTVPLARNVGYSTGPESISGFVVAMENFPA